MSAAPARRRSLARVEESFLQCRSWGHEWDTFQPLRRRAGWGTLLSLRCSRCTTERHDTIDSRGDVSAREYKYPDGYKVAGEHQGDRLTSGEVRLEVLRRLRGGDRRQPAKVVQMRRRSSA